jgi:hypothetical protein
MSVAAVAEPRIGALVSRMIDSGIMNQRCPESKERLIAPNFCGLNSEGGRGMGQRMKDSGHWFRGDVAPIRVSPFPGRRAEERMHEPARTNL